MARKTKFILITIIAVLCLSVFNCSVDDGTEANSIEEESIRNCFTAYKSSILEYNGIEAVKHVNSTTIDYYGEMKDFALTGSRELVEKLSITDKMMVLIIRLYVEPRLLSKMTPEELFVFAVDEGLIGEDATSAGLGDIDISENIAIAQHTHNGQKSSHSWRFEKQGEEWRVDLTSIFPATESLLNDLINESGMSEDEFIFMILEVISGNKVSDDIWEPLVK
jgi:hypothetical protein